MSRGRRIRILNPASGYDTGLPPRSPPSINGVFEEKFARRLPCRQGRARAQAQGRQKSVRNRSRRHIKDRTRIFHSLIAVIPGAGYPGNEGSRADPDSS
jgi:hypothetical protein